MEAVEIAVKKLIFNMFEIDESEIKEESKLRSDLGLDSLDEVELIMECEKELNVHMSDEKASQIVTVGDLYRELKNLVP